MRWTLALTTVVVAGILASPSPARACGGTFCDAGPSSMPIEQAGETIVFVRDGEFVEAHIQIRIDPPDPDAPPAEFAWLIPMPKLPEFGLGSQEFIAGLLDATVPTFQMTTQRDFCGFPGGGGAVGNGCPTGTGAAGTGGVGGMGTTGGGQQDTGVDVLRSETLGAFEMVALTGDDVESIMTWLGDNGYQQDPAAVPILREYLAEGHIFVALKLRSQAAVDEIQPIVLRYEGDEACVPIRLTRIAAVEDMGLRIMFLGHERAVPTNFRHVELNPLRFDWQLPIMGYETAVIQAVDEADPNGLAFITEYSGTSTNVDRSALGTDGWDPARIAALGDQADLAITLLSAMKLVDCGDEVADPRQCDMGHSLMRPLLRQFLPVPEGFEEREFYADLLIHAMLIDRGAWDSEAFAEAFRERIMAPRVHAQSLLAEYPVLTRMYTRLSPHEMVLDPTFEFHAGGLPPVAAVSGGSIQIGCAGPARVSVGGFNFSAGVSFFGITWPSWPEEMPWALRVEQMTAHGAPSVMVDNTDRIQVLAGGASAPRATPVAAEPLALQQCSGIGTTGFPGSDPELTGTGDDWMANEGDDVRRGCSTGSVGVSWTLWGVMFGLVGWRRRHARSEFETFSIDV